MGYYRVVIFGLTPYFCYAISRCGSRSHSRRRCGWDFFVFLEFLGGCEWDRAGRIESRFGFPHPGVVGHGRAYGDGAGMTSARGRAGGADQIRSRMRATCTADHVPAPRAVGMPAPFKRAAIARSDVAPSA